MTIMSSLLDIFRFVLLTVSQSVTLDASAPLFTNSLSLHLFSALVSLAASEYSARFWKVSSRDFILTTDSWCQSTSFNLPILI